MCLNVTQAKSNRKYCWSAVFPSRVGMWGGQGLHADAHVFTASSALDAKSFRFVSCYWAVFTAHLLLMGLKWKQTMVQYCNIKSYICKPNIFTKVATLLHYSQILIYRMQSKMKVLSCYFIIMIRHKGLRQLIEQRIGEGHMTANDPVTKVQ